MKKSLISLLLMLLLAWYAGAPPLAAQPPKGEPANAGKSAERKTAADKAIEEQYAALVATLPPEEQA